MAEPDNGHEPKRLDENHMAMELRKGGAVLVLWVQYKGQLHRCEHIVPGCELSARYTQTATEFVRARLREMVETIDLEVTMDGPVT